MHADVVVYDRCSREHVCILRSTGGGGFGVGHGGSGSSGAGMGCTGGLASSFAGVAGLGMGAKHSRLGYTILPTSAPRKSSPLYIYIYIFIFPSPSRIRSVH